jgi:ABC-type transport system involved in cytochrome c biogenesis permease component
MLAVPLYIRTQSLTYCFLMWLLLMPLCLAFLPVAAEKIVGMMLVLALGGLLFEAIGKFSTYTRS